MPTPKRPPRPRRRTRDKPVIGWREWIGLPEFGIERIKVKIDTGARTSALHAFQIAPVIRDGVRRVRFLLHPAQRRRRPEIACEATIVDDRVVTSSNGERQHRYVIETMARLGHLEFPIEVTLTNRDEMGFRMLLGRQALRDRFIIDPGTSYTPTGSGRTRRAIRKDPNQ